MARRDAAAALTVALFTIPVGDLFEQILDVRARGAVCGNDALRRGDVAEQASAKQYIQIEGASLDPQISQKGADQCIEKTSGDSRTRRHAPGTTKISPCQWWFLVTTKKTA